MGAAMKKWTKPVVGVIGLAAAGAFTFSLDGVAQAVDPLHPKEEHDTFQLVTTTTSGGLVMLQNTVTGDRIEAPLPMLASLGSVKRYKV
jgi:hypothetical protein